MKKIAYLYIVAMLFALISCKKEKKEVVKPIVKEVKVEKLDTLNLIAWRSKLAWRGFALSKSHTGTVKIDSGYIVCNKQNIIKGGELFMDMTSINVVDLKGEKKANLENHLKGLIPGKEDHFFNVKKYPTAKFVIVENYMDEGANILEGDLTIKGVENVVEGFPITLEEVKGKMILKAKNFKIDRTDWEITYASSSVYDDLKENVIKDEMVINIAAAFEIKK